MYIRVVLFSFLIFFSFIAFSQVNCGGIAMAKKWYFDGGAVPQFYSLQIDTNSNANNSWQIGVPNKPKIYNAFSQPNVIITDTSNSYPINDTSVFIFTQIDEGGYAKPHSSEFSAYYNVNTDSLNDYGKIEISLDKGTTWIDLINDTIYNSYYTWWSTKPTLTGNSNGWKGFWVYLAPLGQVFNVNFGDTILLKFTFISDSIYDGLDGLAFDNFQFCNGFEGIEEINNNDIISTFPNPVRDLLYIERKRQSNIEKVKIFNSLGQVIYYNDNFFESYIDFKSINISSGLYYLKYSNSQELASKKIFYISK